MRLIRIFIFLLFVSQSMTLFGQREVEPSLVSPYHTILTHLHYLQTDNYRPDIASMVINPEEVPDSLQRIKKAVRLKKILDGKGLFVRLNRIPRKKNHRDSLTGEHLYTPFPKRMPDVYLERVDTSWYYSSETMRLLPAMYSDVYPLGLDNIVSLFPKWGQREFLGLRAWQYISIVVMLLLAYLIYLLFRLLIRPVVNKLIRRYGKGLLVEPKILTAIVRVLSLYLIVWLIRIVIPALSLPVVYTEFVQLGLGIAMTVIIAVLLFRVVDIKNAYFQRAAEQTEHKMDDQALPIIQRIFKIVIVIGATIHILSLMNVNVTALIAGISIGGLALALAAQDTVKNLIGSLMIFVDRPFQIDDYVSGNGFEGTIKEVGFRSTRIQTIDTSIISVPNGQLANMSVKNFGVRFMRMMDIKIGVMYNTTPAQIEAFVEGLKRIRDIHPRIEQEPSYIHFINMADSSLQIMYRIYIGTTVYADELKIKEQINFAIMHLAEALDIGFAFPSTSVYIESTPERPQGSAPLDNAALKARSEQFFATWEPTRSNDE